MVTKHFHEGIGVILLFFFILFFGMAMWEQSRITQLESKVDNLECLLHLKTRMDNFNGEKQLNNEMVLHGFNGFAIDWEANKKFNEMCGERVDYYFPEDLMELNEPSEQKND